MPIAQINNGDGMAGIRAKLNSLLAAFTLRNIGASAVPTTTDDSSKGYEVGSKWFNKDTGIEYICRDATVGAAVWVRQDNADFFGYVSGSYYHGLNGVVTAGSASGGNSIRLHPIIIKERVTVSELAVRVTTSESGKAFQLALYASDPASKLPSGNPLGVTGNMSAGTTGAMSAALVGGNLTLNPGLYWVAVNTDSTTAIFQQFGSNSTLIAALLGGTAAQVASGNSSSIAFLSIAQAFPTWPDLTSQNFSRGNTAAYAGIFFKVA